MEQNVRPAPDNDLDAYGDWVTVDAATPPVPAGRRVPEASADVEVAGELTDAEEEFLGEVSEADHAAGRGDAAPEAGPTAHNGNGNGNARSEAGPPTRRGGAPSAADTGRHPAVAAAAVPGGEAAAGATGGGAPIPATLAGARAAAPAAAVARPAAAPSPLPAVPVPLTAVPDAANAADAADAADAAKAPDAASAAGAVYAPDAADAPDAAVRDAAAAEQPRHDAPSVADLPATVVAAQPPTTGATPHLPPAGEAVDRDSLASLQDSIAALAADLDEITARVARLQAAGDSGASAEVAPEDSNQVQVSVEELVGEAPAEPGGPVPEPAAAQEAAVRDSQPEPVIRLVPIADEVDDAASDTTTSGQVESAETAAQAAGDSPPHGPAQPHESFRSNVRDVLAYLDQLLDDLPPERVREFAQSAQFATYKALFTELGLDD